MIVVTEVTANATRDSLTNSDYRDIYDEVRALDSQSGKYTMSLDKFVTLVTSAYSKAQWSKYHNGQAELTRTMRNELRLAIGYPALPATLEEAVATAHPDARVVQVGSEQATNIVMIGHNEPVTVHVNGDISVDANVTEVTGGTRRHRPRRRLIRPVASEAQNKRRIAAGLSWREVIEAGLAEYERRWW